MRVFEHPNMHGGFACPICHTTEDKEIVLVGIQGTERDRIMEAEQVHLACLDLTLRRDGDGIVIYQIVENTR